METQESKANQVDQEPKQKEAIPDYDALIAEIANTPRQKFEQPQPSSAQPQEPAPNVDPQAETKEQPGTDFRKIGQSYFTLIDVPVKSMAGYIAGEKPDKFTVDEHNRELLIGAFADLAQEGGWSKPPPWMIVTLLIVFAYGSVMISAFNIRSQKKNIKKTQESKEQKRKVTAEYIEQQLAEGPPYVRDCPSCGKGIEYKSEQTFRMAMLNDTRCKDCVNMGKK
jgi:hypothetical protein